MKKASKIMAIVLCVCLLFSLASVVTFAGPVPNANYDTPKREIAKMTTRPKIDGNLNDWKGIATEEAFTKDALKAGSGQLWSYSEDELLFDELPDDGDGTAYFAWDEEYFYFGLEIEDDENTNNESQSVNLWKGDCLQFQIGKDKTSARYEFGFALSQFGGTRRLGFQWFPLESELKPGGKQDMSKGATNDYYYYVDRKGNKTIYEIALKYSTFGRDAKMSAGDMIPFAFSLQLYSDEADPMNLGETKKYFMEWAKGVVGGTVEKVLDTAGELTLVDKVGPTQSTQSTTNSTTNSTTASTTNSTTGTTGTSNTTSGTGTSNTTSGTKTEPSEGDKTTTTEAPTTTTEPPVVEGTVFFVEENATDVDDTAIIDAIKADFPDKDIAVKKFVATEKKFGIGQDFLEGVYVKDADGKFVALEGTVEEIENEDGSVSEWKMFEVEKDAELYIVKMVPPTTTEAPTTTTEATTTEATTTKAPDTDNEANNEATGDDTTDEGGFPIWIVIVAAVVVIAAVVAFIVLKKKKGAAAE